MSDKATASNEKSEPTKQQLADGPRAPDLSRLDDLKNPFHRLWGIANYCRVLRGYEATAKMYWAASDSAAIRTTIHWTSLDPITQEYDRAQNTLVGTWLKVCEEYYGLLCQWCNAAFPLMPDVVKGLKVLRFGAERLHCNRQTDWKAFEDDLSAIIAHANVLRAEAEGSLPDYPAKPTDVMPAEESHDPFRDYLYQIHAPDAETPQQETLEALNDLVRAGKVRYIGCSNFAAWQTVDALWLFFKAIYSNGGKCLTDEDLEKLIPNWNGGEAMKGSTQRLKDFLCNPHNKMNHHAENICRGSGTVQYKTT